MAFYDNKHWLLSHIRNSFISTDDTGMCEIVMTEENLCKSCNEYTYPGVDVGEEEEYLSNSIENHADLEFGLRRQRSNTAVRLEKMDKERKEAANITRIKWQNPKSFSLMTEDEKSEMFDKKELKKTENRTRKISLLTTQLQKCPHMPQNPFQEYLKFDGNAQIGVPVRKYGIFLTMLKSEHRNYPMPVSVVATAKVYEFIGLILWKCFLQYPDYKSKEKVEYYQLHIAEDDGEVDWVFPCLDPKETVSKFAFKMLALVELKEGQARSEHDSSRNRDTLTDQEIFSIEDKDDRNVDEETNRLHEQMKAIASFIYKPYKVQMLHKVRSKIEVQLGISGEMVDIYPLAKQENIGSKFLSKRKPTLYEMDWVVSCDLTETKSGGRAVFRLVYDASAIDSTYARHEPLSWSCFKHHDFEADQRVAEEIVQKLNHILELRCSMRRKEYLAIRERKSHRKKSFHFGPR